MTRSEFEENVCTYWQLIDFCNDYGFCYCDDLYDDYAYDEYVDQEIKSRIENDNWTDVRDWLSNLPDERDCVYRIDSYGEVTVLDDYDFSDDRDYVVDDLEERGFFEEEEDEESIEEVPPAVEEPSEPVPEEPIDMSDLFTVDIEIPQESILETPEVDAAPIEANGFDEEDWDYLDGDLDCPVSRTVEIIDGEDLTEIYEDLKELFVVEEAI